MLKKLSQLAAFLFKDKKAYRILHNMSSYSALPVGAEIGTVAFLIPIFHSET